MIKLISTIFMTIAMTMTSCNTTAGNSQAEISSLSPAEFSSEMKGSDKVILDVRTPEEYADGHISGAININVLAPDFATESQKTLNKKDTVFVYCRSGKRSMDAAGILTKLGYHVVDLKGGILNWQESGLPVTPAQK
ncbi:MAG: rhodanese-like domain-containing protein [Muribaculaceae bacterium]|nr:rhodanese-like domain-containing protein [Muribaculaceae bacterium]